MWVLMEKSENVTRVGGLMKHCDDTIFVLTLSLRILQSFKNAGREAKGTADLIQSCLNITSNIWSSRDKLFQYKYVFNWGQFPVLFTSTYFKIWKMLILFDVTFCAPASDFEKISKCSRFEWRKLPITTFQDPSEETYVSHPMYRCGGKKNELLLHIQS